jgi:hypothetical protein
VFLDPETLQLILQATSEFAPQEANGGTAAAEGEADAILQTALNAQAPAVGPQLWPGSPGMVPVQSMKQEEVTDREEAGPSIEYSSEDEETLARRCAAIKTPGGSRVAVPHIYGSHYALCVCAMLSTSKENKFWVLVYATIENAAFDSQIKGFADDSQIPLRIYRDRDLVSGPRRPDYPPGLDGVLGAFSRCSWHDENPLRARHRGLTLRMTQTE